MVIRGHEQIKKKVGFKLRRKNKEFNTCITVRAEDNNNDPERMIRRFRKLVKNEGIMQEIYDRRYYTSPSEVRREEKRQRQRVINRENRRREELFKPRDRFIKKRRS